ncbi:MAG: hypothetical protein KDK12_15405 [Rhodobacteraceae bacterium]|nr:hypothetical protein [Paracoccaceae bacterium]
MLSLPRSFRAALLAALPTLAAGAVAGAYAILMLAAGQRDGQNLGYALALGLAVLVPFETTALWMRRGAPLPRMPALPRLPTLTRPATRPAPFPAAFSHRLAQLRRRPEPAPVIPAE